MRTISPPANTTRRVGDDSSHDGSSTRTTPGSGAEPAMLSTAIFSGTGVSSAIGVGEHVHERQQQDVGPVRTRLEQELPIQM